MQGSFATDGKSGMLERYILIDHPEIPKAIALQISQIFVDDSA